MVKNTIGREPSLSDPCMSRYKVCEMQANCKCFPFGVPNEVVLLPLYEPLTNSFSQYME